MRAVERALADLEAGYGANEISLLVSATESHTQKNLNRGRDEQWENIADMVRAADGRFRWWARCRSPSAARSRARSSAGRCSRTCSASVGLGVRHVALGDTTGMATPRAVKRHVRPMLDRLRYLIPIAHFHDSRGTGLVNYVAAYEAGVRHFDSSFGGVGGHPAKVKYGGGYTGNVCTEDLVSLFESMGIDTGIDLDGLLDTARFCEQTLGRELHGRVTRSGVNPLLDRPVTINTREK